MQSRGLGKARKKRKSLLTMMMLMMILSTFRFTRMMGLFLIMMRLRLRSSFSFFSCCQIFSNKISFISAIIFTLDSLGGKHAKVGNVLSKYLQAEAKDKKTI